MGTKLVAGGRKRPNALMYRETNYAEVIGDICETRNYSTEYSSIPSFSKPGPTLLSPASFSYHSK